MRGTTGLAVLLIAHAIGLFAQPVRVAAEACEEILLIRSEPAVESERGCTLDGKTSLSYGGEVRQRYEYTSNPGFGADVQDPRGVWLQRYAVHGELRWHEDARLFAELRSALESGRAAGPSPVDQDALEFQNLFLQARLPVTHAELQLRLGRQEMQFGSARLVSVRDGPNVRRTFDGVRAIARAGPWTFNLLALHPRKDRQGTFDDSADKGRTLWGVYSTGQFGGDIDRGIDLYYLGYQNDDAVFDQGSAAERRHTLGMRYFGSQGGWEWNLEPMVQFGRYGNANLRAWTVASETSYTWSHVTLRPSLKLSANVASGDRDPDDPDLETFNPLFPRGNYFSEDAILGPQNFYNAHVFLTLRPSQSWSLTVDHNWFWRFSIRDGVYGPSGNLVRSGAGSDARFVASALSLNSEWAIGRHWTLTAIYTRVSPEQFLEETGPAEDVDIIELTARFRY